MFDFTGFLFTTFPHQHYIVHQIFAGFLFFFCNYYYFFFCYSGDVLSGSKPEGSVHLGVLQEWFGIHWWNSREFSILFTVVFIMLPLVLLRRVGKY